MDPAAALLSALKYCEDVAHSGTDYEILALAKSAAADSFRNLADWLDNGGFTPDAAKVCKKFLEELS